MKREKQKRTRIIIALTAVLLLMTVGYAAYNTNLNITGTSNISNSWDIEITNISDPVLTGSAKHVAKEIGTNKLSASMEADLYDKGDSAEYTVTIENKGSVDAALDSITKDTSNSDENIDITFTNYTKGERLESGKTIDIKVKIAYPTSTAFNSNTNNSNIKLLSTDSNTLATGEVKITFNFVQAEGYKDSEDYPIPDTYLVEYDCTTNGGKDCTEFNEYLKEGESVNLTNNPGRNKDNENFLGWNTDKDASEGIGSLSVTNETIDENNKIKLYAIYQQKPLEAPTFEENIEEDKTIVTINYQEGCGSKLICRYKIDDGEFQTVTSTTQNVEFTKSSTVTAKVTRGANEVSSNYTVTFVDEIAANLTLSITNTAKTISVIANSSSENITKYEFKINDNEWIDNGTSNTYKFNNLTNNTEYQIKVRITDSNGSKITSSKTITTNLISTPEFIETVGNPTIVTIIYPDGCTDYTCTYQKDSETALNVTQSMLDSENTIDIEFTDNGTLVATTTDGTNTASASYTVTFTGGSGIEEFSYQNSVQEYTVPYNGDYKLEVWGAEGGYGYTNSTTYAGGKGGYSYGTVTLSKGDKLYIYTGGQGTAGSSTSSIKSGGFNGGGDSGYYQAGSGGGASDIRINEDSLNARVIVAGGGGGGADYSKYYGGAGGGTAGINGTGYNSTYNAKEGTQTAGGAAGGYSGYTGTAGSFGQGGAANTSTDTSYSRSGGGGGGWYGGGGGGYRSSSSYYYYGVSGGGGGSGYVYTEDTDSNKPSTYTLDTKYRLTDAETIAGNTSFTSPTGKSETGHSGNGYARISYNILENNKLSLSVNNFTDTTISVTAKTDVENITKYEFKVGNGNWINNNTSNTYTFTNLTVNTKYKLYVRTTTSSGQTVVASLEQKTFPLPTFSSKDTETEEIVTIKYINKCNSDYTCSYKKNEGEWTTVTDSSAKVTFTEADTLTAKITDGTTTTTSTYSVTFENVEFESVNTTSTTNSITVVAKAIADSGIAKYEYSLDGEEYFEGTIDTTNNNSTYTFTNLKHGKSYRICVKIITKLGKLSIYEIKKATNANKLLIKLAATDTTTMNKADPVGNIRYMGKNPNNYITFNNDTYRIIGLFGDNIKIIKSEVYGSLARDSNGTNDWSKASLMKNFNSGDYWNSLSTTAKNQIAETTWYLGGSNYTAGTTSTVYSWERGATVYTGNPTTWSGKVALMYPSDYGYASSSCYTGTKTLYEYNDSSCTNSNWLYLNNKTYEWLLSPYSNDSKHAFCVVSEGRVHSSNYANVCNSMARSVRPVLYLKSNIGITGGSGTPGNPYEINNTSVETKLLETPTFTEAETNSGKTITIDYHKECGSNGITCTYIKNGETTENLTGSTQTVDFTSNGTLVATISDGTNTVNTSSYTVKTGTAEKTIQKLGTTVVTSGTGLYQDSTETGRYIYKGSAPNNYITFNGETWRIYSIEDDGRIKITRSDLLSSMAFDAKNARPTASNSYCTGDYGCNAWAANSNIKTAAGGSVTSFENGSETGTVTIDSEMKTYLNGTYYNSLTSTAKSQIEESTWNVGPAGEYNDTYTLSQLVSSTYEGKYTWTGNIALLTKSEYMRASSNTSCITAKYWYDSRNSTTCKGSDYLYNSSTNWWLLSPWSDSVNNGLFANGNGFVAATAWNSNIVSNNYGVRPALYLKSSISLSGSGTSNSPYTIVE